MMRGWCIGAIVSVFGATFGFTPALAQIDRGLEGSRWTIVEVFGEAVPQDFSPYIVFDGSGRLSGRTACNWFHGTYSADSDAIVILTNLTTLRGCEVDNRRRPDPTLEALDSSAQFAIAGSVLTLADGGGEAVAKLERRSGE
jgi:heat shock protein HslJ